MEAAGQAAAQARRPRAVLTGRREDYSDHPTTAVLIVEVSDITLRYDRGHKASLYACVGIEEY